MRLKEAIRRLKENDSTLTTLDLTNNSIGDQGAKALAEALKENTVLTTLYLFFNSIGDEGAKALAEALKKNTVLTTLYLGSNSVGDEGAKALAEALKKNTVLTELYLRYNSIGDEGAKAFLKCLENNVSLKELTLSDNKVSEDLRAKVENMIKSNQDGSRAKTDHPRPQNMFQDVKPSNDVKLDPDAKLIAKTSPPVATTHDKLNNGMQDPGSRRTAMVDSPIATSRKNLKDVMLNPDSEPTLISPEYIVECTNNFAKDRFLGGGAFGAVYEGLDVVTNGRFAVKRVPLEITDQETLHEIQLSFKREITALKRFRHPNIIVLFAYYLSTETSKQFLVYELAPRGSVARFLMDDKGRARLSSSIRLSILFQVTRALHFLHTGGCGGFIVFHRDIKSANICLMQNYTAKLIDAGLAKFVTVDESQRTGSVTPSILKSSGAAAFGTPGYICKWYAGGNRVFQAKCDVYSLGVVIMELVTGCLQGGQSRRHDVSFNDFYDCYVEDENEDEIKDGYKLLMKHADPMLEWDPQVLETICKSAVKCLSRKVKDRPSTDNLVTTLQWAILLDQGNKEVLKHLAEGGAAPLTSCSTARSQGPSCCLCNRVLDKYLTCRHHHTTCSECAVDHLNNLLKSGVEATCPREGCSSLPFMKEELYSKIPHDLYERFCQDTKLNLLLCNQNLMLQNQVQMGHQLLDIKSKLSRSLHALALLSVGVTAKCPKLVWVTLADRPHTKDPIAWVKGQLTKRYRLYFICEYSFDAVKPPIEFGATRDYVKQLAPALRVGLICLKVFASAYGLPFPIPNIGFQEQLKLQTDFWNALMDGGTKAILDQFETSLNSSISLSLKDGKLEKLIGPCYELIAEKANKPKRAEWKDAMVPVVNHFGTPIWVKKEFKHVYD